MIQRQFIEQMKTRAKNYVPSEFLNDWEALKQCANLGYVFVWPIGFRLFRWFYQKSAAFTATANAVAKPSDCALLLSVEIPGTTQGHATPVPVSEFATTQGMAEQAGTAKNPKFQEDKSFIQLYPFQDATPANFTGTFHYIRNIGYVDDDDFELSVYNANALPHFPEMLEEDAMNEAIRQLHLRSRGLQDSPSSIESLLDGYEDLMDKAKQHYGDPLAVYAEQTPGSLGNGRGLPQS